MKFLLVLIFCGLQICDGANILMVTLGGSKSHKLIFTELARGLIPRNHNITFISPYTSDTELPGLTEIVPPTLQNYVTETIIAKDYVGARMNMTLPVNPWDALMYLFRTCDMMFGSSEVRAMLSDKSQNFDLIIIDGFNTDCATAFVHHYKVPFIFINTLNYCTWSFVNAGNSCPISVYPFFMLPFSHSMTLLERATNAVFRTFFDMMYFSINKMSHLILRQYFSDIPDIDTISKNVSFILQNSHNAITGAKPYLPNVAEIACIHCRPPRKLPKNLEDFIDEGGNAGFIIISFGTCGLKTVMPQRFKEVFFNVFRRIPQRVIWQWSNKNISDIPSNVMLIDWLPQQDLLGHPKIKAFINHGGLNSIYEAVYHGVPSINLPLQSDHDHNSAVSESFNYSIMLSLISITEEQLYTAINEVINNSKYRNAIKERQVLFHDQKMTSLERAIYWTEYVIRHKGAPHLQSLEKDLNFIQYYLIDVFVLLTLIAWFLQKSLSFCIRYIRRMSLPFRKPKDKIN